MHGGKWHDVDQPVSDSDLVSNDVPRDAEFARDRIGMGRSRPQDKSSK